MKLPHHTRAWSCSRLAMKSRVILRLSRNEVSPAVAMRSAAKLHAPSHHETSTPAEPPNNNRHPERRLGRLCELRRSEGSLTLRGRRRAGGLCAPSLPPPPPALVSAILHCAPPRLRPRGAPFRMTACFFDGRRLRRRFLHRSAANEPPVLRAARFGVRAEPRRGRSADFQISCIAGFQTGCRSARRGVCGLGNPRYRRLGSLRYGPPARLPVHPAPIISPACLVPHDGSHLQTDPPPRARL